MNKIRLSIHSLALFILLPGSLSGQPTSITLTTISLNTPQYPAVPFLAITPDARGGSLGDAGVATMPDINSQYWNPAKYAFIDDRAGVALSYTPWLRKLINDVSLWYAAGFYRIDRKQVISTSFRYFSLGEIVLLTTIGTVYKEYHPEELAIDAAYSRKLSEKWSVALALRYIRSDLTGRNVIRSAVSEYGTALAGDLAFYHNRNIVLFNTDSQLALGLNLSNIGNKIFYSDTVPGTFLPINMKLGGALTIPWGPDNSISLTTDLNKLMVPTPPEYGLDGHTILYGKDPDVPVLQGMIRSFWDAPGEYRANGQRSVLLEELHEITYSFGVEYWYRHKLAVRGGYFSEHETKGIRKYLTLGAGFQLNSFALEGNYLLPVQKDSPMINTFRITVTLQLGENVFPGIDGNPSDT